MEYHIERLYLSRPLLENSVDCWRVFEAHWLGLSGQPQSAAIQCVLAASEDKIDSFILKQLFLSLNQKKFLNCNNVIAFLSEESLRLGKETQWSTFQPCFGAPELAGLSGHFYHTHSVRFICEQSGQPFTGEIQLILSEPLSDADQLHWLLLDKRSARFDPVSYTDAVYNSLLSWGCGFILSVHLARRGGISYQGLRWHQQAFIDPQSLLQLSSIE